jgi:hypothetical protein
MAQYMHKFLDITTLFMYKPPTIQSLTGNIVKNQLVTTMIVAALALAVPGASAATCLLTSCTEVSVDCRCQDDDKNCSFAVLGRHSGTGVAGVLKASGSAVPMVMEVICQGINSCTTGIVGSATANGCVYGQGYTTVNLVFVSSDVGYDCDGSPSDAALLLIGAIQP